MIFYKVQLWSYRALRESGSIVGQEVVNITNEMENRAGEFNLILSLCKVERSESSKECEEFMALWHIDKSRSALPNCWQLAEPVPPCQDTSPVLLVELQHIWSPHSLAA